MLREVKFYARDILRGPNAKSVPGWTVSAVLTALIILLAFFGLVALL